MRRRVKGAVRLLKVDLRVKRLMRFQVVPIGRIERFCRRSEIPVGLRAAFESGLRRHFLHIRREVTRLAHAVADQPHARRQRVTIVPMAAMIVRADRRLIHPRVERTATR